jgi:hypothetical protein
MARYLPSAAVGAEGGVNALAQRLNCIHQLILLHISLLFTCRPSVTCMDLIALGYDES